MDNTSLIRRYIFDKVHAKGKDPHPNSFRSGATIGDISVYEISFLNNHQSWKIGAKVNPSATLKAALDMRVVDVVNVASEEGKKFDLLVRRQLNPSWWHANITPCPVNEEDFKSLTLALSEIAQKQPNPFIKEMKISNVPVMAGTVVPLFRKNNV